jgi:hypothetical protein
MDVEFENRVRISIYRHFASHCRAPTIAEVAAALVEKSSSVRDAFVSLAEKHVLVLQPGSGELWMAMPFSAVPTGFRVHVPGSSWWANCAWDALGVLAALGQDGEVETQCANSSDDMIVAARGGSLDWNASGVIHFAVPAAHWWDDIGYT